MKLYSRPYRNGSRPYGRTDDGRLYMMSDRLEWEPVIHLPRGVNELPVVGSESLYEHFKEKVGK